MEKNSFDDYMVKMYDRIRLPKPMRWMEDGFTIVPNKIIVAKQPKELKILYITLLMFAFKKKRCFPGCEIIAKYVGANRRTVIRNLKKLEEIKWIKIEKRPGSSSIYNLLF
jgi:hypothetical protein